MREAVKAEFLMNAANCEVPYSYAMEMATGQKEQALKIVMEFFGEGIS